MVISFIAHKLIKDKDGYIVVLYLNPKLIETAKEFNQKIEEKEKGLKQNISFYIKNKLPQLKVITVKIMFGSLLITSLAVINGASSNNLDFKTVKKAKEDILLQNNNVKNIVKEENEKVLLVNKNNSLAANYIPLDLVVTYVPFPFTEFHEKKLMREEAARALEDLFAKAKQDNIDLYAISGYRSYDRQKEIFTTKAQQVGLAQANQFSAQAGQSEHQTGLAMDVSSSKVNFHLVQEFANTKEGEWLKEYASQFGFIIRYPQEKEEITGYKYEPWHIRYIGKDKARQIAKKNLSLEEYLQKV